MFQVISSSQDSWDKSKFLAPGVKEIIELIRVAKGVREFSMIRITFSNGDMRIYLNEWIGSQLESIEDDNLFDDLSAFIDDYFNKIKPEGSDI